MIREISDYLFATAAKKISSDQSLPHITAALLNISISAAYRKIKGETPLNTSEVFILSKHFGISLDAFNGQSPDMFLFRYPPLSGVTFAPEDFFTGALGMIRRLGGPGPQMHLRYSTYEIPFFYYLLFPELTAFKMYVWSHSAWDGRTKSDWPFLLRDENLHRLRRELFDAFSASPSAEFYPINMLDNTLNQLHFLHTTGALPDPDFFDTILQQLSDMTDQMENAAARGQKNCGGQLELYYNEITYTNNLILANNGDHYILVVTLDNPNYLVSTDERLTRHINGWFEQIRAKSTRISTGGEKHRTYYFNELRRRIQEAKRRPGV
jgi:hypothetical protein